MRGKNRGWTWATLLLAIALVASNVGDVTANPGAILSWLTIGAAAIAAVLAGASIRRAAVRERDERERVRRAEDKAAYERGYPDRSK